MRGPMPTPMRTPGALTNTPAFAFVGATATTPITKAQAMPQATISFFTENSLDTFLNPMLSIAGK